MKKALLAIALFIVFGSAGAYAQSAKLGYVDSRAVSDKLPEVKQAYSVLNEFSKAKEAELRKEAEAFQKRVQEFEQAASTMEPKLASSKQRELEAQNEQLQIKQTSAQSEIQKKQQQLFEPIEKKIQDAINTVATENGYTYVFAKEVLLHYPAGDDISELVVKKLLANAPKDQTTQNKPAAGSTTPKKN